ncbi:MAG: hypothetical protein GZ094_11000 [Mariniphaga sp.]|nr:hypothetical protein [Mariniphaga sp.]
MNTSNEKIPIIRELEEKVKEVQPLQGENKKELLQLFQKGLCEINDAKIHYLQLLDFLADTDSDFNALYQNASRSNFADCVDKLNSIGTQRKKNEVLKKAFQSMGYRLMEQTRAGKKDEVFHGILRLYMTCNQSFDKELLIAFKQSNNEMFKVLIFSFLSGIIE